MFFGVVCNLPVIVRDLLKGDRIELLEHSFSLTSVLGSHSLLISAEAAKKLRKVVPWR